MERVTNRRLKEMFGTLVAVGKQPTEGSVKYKWGLARNEDKLEREVRLLDKAEIAKPSKDMTEFNEKREELAQEFADRDENGEIIIDKIRRQYVVADVNQAALDVKMNALRAQFKEVLDAEEKRKEQYIELLEDERDFDFYKVPMSIIPEDLNSHDMSVLMPIWSEEEDNVVALKDTKKKKKSNKKSG